MTTSTLTPEAISYVCTTVRQRSAIELDISKTYLIEARLAPVAKQNGFASIDELIQAVKDSAFLVITGETGSGKTTQLPQYRFKLKLCCECLSLSHLELSRLIYAPF